jgi:hypothetical protein
MCTRALGRPGRASALSYSFVRSLLRLSVPPCLPLPPHGASSSPFRLLASRNTGDAAVCTIHRNRDRAHTRPRSVTCSSASPLSSIHAHTHSHTHIHTRERTHVRTHVRTHARTFSRERTPEFRLPQFHAQAATRRHSDRVPSLD